MNIEASADVPQTAVPLAVTIGWLQERAIPHMLLRKNVQLYSIFTVWPLWSVSTLSEGFFKLIHLELGARPL